MCTCRTTSGLHRNLLIDKHFVRPNIKKYKKKLKNIWRWACIMRTWNRVEFIQMWNMQKKGVGGLSDIFESWKLKAEKWWHHSYSKHTPIVTARTCGPDYLLGNTSKQRWSHRHWWACTHTFMRVQPRTLLRDAQCVLTKSRGPINCALPNLRMPSHSRMGQ